MTKFFRRLICLAAGCDLKRITKTRVRLGREYFALYICDRCDTSTYIGEGEA